MSIRFYDGVNGIVPLSYFFDFIQFASIVNGAGPFGRNAIYIPKGFLSEGALIKKLDLQSSWTVTFRFHYDQIFDIPPFGTLVELGQYNATPTIIDEIVSLLIDNDSTLFFRAGGTFYHFNSPALNTRTWYYLELDVTTTTVASLVHIHINSLKLNGQTILLNVSFDSTIATASTQLGSPSANAIVWHSVGDGGHIYLTDILVADNVNPGIGDFGIITCIPDGNDTPQDWTGTYTDINENPLNDATYITTAFTAKNSRFTFSNLPAGTNILNVELNTIAQGTTGTEIIDPIAGSTLLSSITLTNFFKVFKTVISLNPVTSTGWTISDFNAMSFGYRSDT